jgi:hypothetical protein
LHYAIISGTNKKTSFPFALKDLSYLLHLLLPLLNQETNRSYGEINSCPDKKHPGNF